MHAVEEEDAFAEGVEQFVQSGPVGASSGAGAFETFEDALFVAVGLEASDEPRAAVGQRFVIEVGGVLRGDEDAEAEGAGLFEEEEKRAFGRRVGDGREVAEDFVHVEQRAQRRCAGLAAHPGDDFFEQGGDEKHALGIGEVGDAEDGEAGFAFGRVEEAGDVERFAFAPGGESG